MTQLSKVTFIHDKISMEALRQGHDSIMTKIRVSSDPKVSLIYHRDLNKPYDNVITVY